MTKIHGKRTGSVLLIPIHGIPLIQPGDDLVKIILDALASTGNLLAEGDVLVLTQKIVSKAEGAMVELTSCRPSKRAARVAKRCGKDPRVVDLILKESKKVLRQVNHVIVTEHRQGWVCANAGIDFSNVPGQFVTLLPKDADETSRRIRRRIKTLTGSDIAVLIIDSQGRPFRRGAIGVAIGCAGMRCLVTKRGSKDLFHYRLQGTEIAMADELASAASLLMGQADEGIPAVLIRGFAYPKGRSDARDLIRPEEYDYFR
jgi:coenzyme F420-0:L-glutamate ligase / coenzyme F420-1:gamma-L-glutamate ligase